MFKKIIRYSLKGIYFLLLINNIYFLYNISLLNNIENLIRLLICIFILIISLILGYLVIIKGKKKKTEYNIVLLIILLILNGSLLYINISFNNIYNKISNISNSYTTYSTSLVTLSSNKIDNAEDIKEGIIGIIKDKDNVDGYILPNKAISELNLKNEIKSYDTYVDLLEALYNKDVEYIFMPSNYILNYSSLDKYVNIKDETKIIYTKKKQEENKVVKTASVTEPFTVLLMGVDSETEGIENSTFNGDSLILVTFNPNTLTTTMLSIPRDTYVPISCFLNDRKNKITHSAWYGEECVINTIEGFLDITIDYYVKINFKGIVSLVDALGGVDVYIPYNFCEQNSNRSWGDDTVYVEEGNQHLNGEQALAFARNRHPNPDYCSSKWTNYESNDFVRGANQQTVIKAMLEKLKSVRDINTIYDLLDTISNNMGTNMPTNQILSFYNVAKDVIIKSQDDTIDNIITIKKLALSGHDAIIYDYSMFDKQGMKLELYDFVLYDDSVKDVINAMKINLGKIEEEVIKDFSFEINNPYVEKTIGSGYYSGSSLELLPDFIGKDIEYVLDYGNKSNIKINVEYVETDDTSKKIGEVINQDPNRKLDMDYFNNNIGLTIYVVKSYKKVNNTVFNYSMCFEKDTKDNQKCVLPNFVGESEEVLTTWQAYLKGYVTFNKVKVLENDELYDKNNIGLIISQDKKANTTLYDLLNKTVTIKYIEKVTIENNEEEPKQDDDEIEPKQDDEINDNEKDNSVIE